MKWNVAIARHAVVSPALHRVLSGGAKQFKHLPVDLVALRVFVVDVFAATIENAEIAAKVPERVSPAGFAPNRETVGHPGQRDLVRGLVIAAPLADMHLHAEIRERLPLLDVFLFEL